MQQALNVHVQHCLSSYSMFIVFVISELPVILSCSACKIGICKIDMLTLYIVQYLLAETLAETV